MKKNNLAAALLLSAALLGISATPVLAETEMYRSELTNEWISAELKDQRPIAAIVDNEVIALDHFGVNQADVVYELMNSTANNRITRLMCIVKDWEKIEQLGSIRSARSTNFMLAAEYNAIVVHDGGPFYIDEYIARDYTNNISGGFARFSNGKDAEFTEYITAQDYTNPNTGKSFAGLLNRFAQSGYSKTYNEFYPGTHFTFSDDEFDLSVYESSVNATSAVLPFPHNGSTLTYNPATGTYDYSEYKKAHIDALDQSVTTFKNVILQNCDFTLLDQNGYMVYDVITSTANNGYYLTNGKAIPITWKKETESGLTEYMNSITGQPLTMNTGKTYIALIPSDSFGQLILQ